MCIVQGVQAEDAAVVAEAAVRDETGVAGVWMAVVGGTGDRDCDGRSVGDVGVRVDVTETGYPVACG